MFVTALNTNFKSTHNSILHKSQILTVMIKTLCPKRWVVYTVQNISQSWNCTVHIWNPYKKQQSQDSAIVRQCTAHYAQRAWMVRTQTGCIRAICRRHFSSLGLCKTMSIENWIRHFNDYSLSPVGDGENKQAEQLSMRKQFDIRE